jgi:hypothetical protein
MMVTRQILDEHRRRTWYFILLNKCIQLMTERLESELTPYRLVRWIWSLDCQVGWVCVKSTTRRCVAVCSHNCTTKQFLTQTTGASFHASTKFGKSTTRRCVAVCSHNCTTKQFLTQTTGALLHASTKFGKSTTRRCVAVCSHNCTTKQFLAQTTGASFHASTQFGTRQQLGHKATQRHPTIIVWVLNCALWRQLGGYSGSLPATVNSSNKQGGLLKDSQGKEGSRLQVNWL